MARIASNTDPNERLTAVTFAFQINYVSDMKGKRKKKERAVHSAGAVSLRGESLLKLGPRTCG